MNTTTLQEKIFGGNNIVSLSEEYPYFGMAHYYALKNATDNNIKNDALAANASLFFNNSYYLQMLLQGDNKEDFSSTSILQTDNFTNTENIISKKPAVIFEKQKEESKKIETKEIEKEYTANINETENTETAENLAVASTIPLANILKESDTQETELSFEPLYTSDYFASQGIKLSNVVLPNDKLGLQLKTFTSWLKTMKKTHTEKLPTNNILAEVAIQKLAENSNVDAEIYTEPMAEAYAQQGKYIKAIEIYSKLSLMFPEKSAFFADKIENLK